MFGFESHRLLHCLHPSLHFAIMSNMTFQINVVDDINQGDVAASGNIENTSGIVPNTPVSHFSHQLPFEYSFEFCPDVLLHLADYCIEEVEAAAAAAAAADAEVEAEIMAFDFDI